MEGETKSLAVVHNVAAVAALARALVGLRIFRGACWLRPGLRQLPHTLWPR